MKKIILDTNFLLTALKFKVDIFSELDRICNFNYKVGILDKSLEELKRKKLEKLALEYIKKKGIDIIKTKDNKIVDDLLLEFNDSIIATQDKKLKEKLKKKKIKRIILKKRKFLVLEDVL